MDFVTGLSITITWKKMPHNSILVIVAQLTKIVYYEPIKITIDTPRLVEVIIDMAVWHYDKSDSIVTERGSLLTSKFWSFLYYFFGIKR